MDNGPLDASLFEMPAGCRVVTNYQDLLNVGGHDGRTSGSAGACASGCPEPASKPKLRQRLRHRRRPWPRNPAGVVRVGVVKIKDATEQFLPTENLRINLMSEVSLRQMEAVPLDSDSDTTVMRRSQVEGLRLHSLHRCHAGERARLGRRRAARRAYAAFPWTRPSTRRLLAITLYRVGKPLPELKQAPLAADGEQMGCQRGDGGLREGSAKRRRPSEERPRAAEEGHSGQTTRDPQETGITRKFRSYRARNGWWVR